MKICPVESHCGQMTKLVVAFRSFAKMRKT